jgi:hypothetical protein
MIDFKKAIHLVARNSARGILHQYFKTDYPDDEIEIHSIYDDLSVGPLNDCTSSTDYDAYADYWRTFEETTYENQPSDESFATPTVFFEEFTINFPQEKPLIIWHGSDTQEKIMLYRYCALLNRDLYEINLDEWPVNSQEEYNSNSLATRNPEHLNGIFKLIKKTEDTKKHIYAQEWERLKDDQKSVRIFRDGKVISVEENYYDQAVIDNCSSDFKTASKVIGETMAQQKSTVGDHFLWYRIQILIKQNLLEKRGNQITMRDLEIRKK